MCCFAVLRQVVISQLIFAIRLASGMAFYTAAQRRWHSTKTILRKLPFHYRPFKLPTYAMHFDTLTIDVVWTIIPVEVVRICYKLSLPTFWAVRFRAIGRRRLWRRTAESVLCNGDVKPCRGSSSRPPCSGRSCSMSSAWLARTTECPHGTSTWWYAAPCFALIHGTYEV